MADINVNTLMETITKRLRLYTRELREQQLRQDLDRVWCILEKHIPNDDLRQLHDAFEERARAHIELMIEKEVEQAFWIATKKQIEKDVFKEHRDV